MPEVNLRLRIDSDGNAKIVQTGEQIKHVGEESDSAGEKIKQLAEAFAVFEIGKLAVETMTESLKAFGEKQDSINSLNMALASQGKYTTEASHELLEYANVLEETSTFTDDAALKVESYYARIGVGLETIPKLTQATADFAAVTGEDLASASLALGKAIETGSGRQLGLWGITVDKSATAQERLDSIMAQLEERMGGSAAAATTTYAGAHKQLENSIDQAHEQFGFFLATLTGSDKPYGVAIEAVRGLKDIFAALIDAQAGLKKGFWDVEAEVLQFAATTTKLAEDHPIISSLLGIGKDTSGIDSSKLQEMANFAVGQAQKAIDDGVAAQKKYQAGDWGTVTPKNGAPGSGLADPGAAARAAKENEEAIKAEDKAWREYSAANKADLAQMAKLEIDYAQASGASLSVMDGKIAKIEAEGEAQMDTADAILTAKIATGDSNEADIEAYADKIALIQATTDLKEAELRRAEAQKDAALATKLDDEGTKALNASIAELHPGILNTIQALADETQKKKDAAEASLAQRIAEEGLTDSTRALQESVAGYEAKLDQTLANKTAFEEHKALTKGLGEAWHGVESIMRDLGVSSDSTFGKIMSDVDKAIDIFKSMKDVIGSVSSILKLLGGDGGGLGGLLGGGGGLGGLLGIGKSGAEIAGGAAALGGGGIAATGATGAAAATSGLGAAASAAATALAPLAAAAPFIALFAKGLFGSHTTYTQDELQRLTPNEIRAINGPGYNPGGGAPSDHMGNMPGFGGPPDQATAQIIAALQAQLDQAKVAAVAAGAPTKLDQDTINMIQQAMVAALQQTLP